MENYHIAESFKVIKSNDDYNIFCNLSTSEYKTIRKRIIDCVLATDMIFHGKQVVFLKGKIETFSIKHGEGSEKMIVGLDANAQSAIQQEFMNVFIQSGLIES